jgi:hypothetical protein
MPRLFQKNYYLVKKDIKRSISYLGSRLSTKSNKVNDDKDLSTVKLFWLFTLLVESPFYIRYILWSYYLCILLNYTFVCEFS